MKSVLLAAGNGGRLRPLTADTAKVMVEVDGRPMLSRSLDHLADAGIEEAVVVVGYLGEQLIDYYGDTYRGVGLQYVRQDDQLGTAHALLSAEEAIDGDFVLLHPDNVYGPSFDLATLLDAHRRTGAGATVLVDDVNEERAKNSGVVVRGEDGEAKQLVEKPDDPPSPWRICGSYVLPSRIFDYCRRLSPPSGVEYELTAALNRLVESGRKVSTVELETWVVNVNTPADRDDAEAALTRD